MQGVIMEKQVEKNMEYEMEVLFRVKGLRF